jgi:Skp family chaperone for outer membrane proteins
MLKTSGGSAMQRLRLAAVVTGILCAIEPAAAQVPASPAPKVAVINLGTVFTRYEKAIHFKKQMEETLQPFKKEIEGLQQEMNSLRKLQAVPMPEPALAQQLQERLTEKAKQIEGAQDKAKKVLGKQNEDNLLVLWQEINEAARRQAEAQDFTLLLAYGEPALPGQVAPLANINRKLQAVEHGGVVPLYFHASIDITDRVVQVLNDAYRKGAPPREVKFSPR